MLVLTIRTDKPDAEIGLFESGNKLEYEVWQAHRALAETIHSKIEKVLEARGFVRGDLEGVVAYKGPGSFTGLRIGLSVANALAYSLSIPIVGIEGEEGWLEKGLESIAAGRNERMALPEYGSPAHITQPKS